MNNQEASTAIPVVASDWKRLGRYASAACVSLGELLGEKGKAIGYEDWD
jgi:hypothetical protein